MVRVGLRAMLPETLQPPGFSVWPKLNVVPEREDE